MKTRRGTQVAREPGAPSGGSTVHPEPAAAEVTDPGPRREGWYTTGEMARLTNNTLRTVRFYEEAGILQPIGRTEGGHRLFEPGQLDRLKFVTDMREAGMGLEEIRDLLETKQRAQSGGTAAVNAVMALKTHIRQLEDKLAVLARLHEDLSRTASCASACMGCEGEALFPNHCDDCSKIAAVTDMPRGMRVLWSLKTSGSLDGATVTAAAAAAGGNLPSGEPPSAE